jgi:thymidylate synthase (FAD)
MNLSKLREKQKKLIKLVYRNTEKELISDFLFFSYIGARICYASSHPLLLFYEEKFRDYEKFRDFLFRLKKAGHFSVFAHTPVFVNTENLSPEEKFQLASIYFKVFWDEETKKALFNLRHFAENLQDETFMEILEKKPDFQIINIKIFKNYEKVFEGRFTEIDQKVIEQEKKEFAEPEVVIIEVKKNHPFRWIGVIVHNFSRIFSHQFVRHTWLNFNQRSHRYTFVDSFVVPESFEEKHRKVYGEVIKNSMKFYKEFCKEMKKESARFLVPQGVATTLLATGPYLVWQDFISKRAIPHAQEEIRKLATLLKETL